MCIHNICRRFKPNNMAKISQGRAQDRAKVAGGQKHEVNYEAIN